eukprot:TRINITY_DN727_c0_g1_i1.p1 TRINITY_DN727_c0_g1~~TRINITY_DN727_c0_g1_i1.p1  ORF type:complete len:376 (+),score=106.78 TRINITY_DN727_c0_g1_i1:10-1137(+)
MYRTLLLLSGLCLVSSQRPSIPPGFNLGLVKEQIGEIMIVCGENPSTCECGNGRTLDGDKFFPAIFGCNPKSCLCPNGLSVNDLEDVEPDRDLTQEKFMTMMSVGNFMGHWSKIGDMFNEFCDGSAPTSCSCANGDEISKFTKNANKLGICRPQICKCGDGSSKEVPDAMKYSFLHQMEKMCDVEECGCTKSDMSIIPPFESASQVADCAPQSCACKDGSSKDLPSFPALEDNMIDTLEEYASKRFLKFANLCDGELPTFCECKKRPEPLTEFTNKEDMKKCYPTTCTCLNGSVKPAPGKRGSFNRIIEDLEAKVGRDQMDRMTMFYQSKYSKFIPGFGGAPAGFPSQGPPAGFPPGGPPFGSGQIPDFVRRTQN